MNTKPINKTNLFNSQLPVAAVDWLAADIVCELSPSILRIHVTPSIVGILSVKRTYNGVSVNEQLNGGSNLVAGAIHYFDLAWREGETINLFYSTPSLGAPTCANGTGTCTGSPVALILGANTITVTGAGTFTITLPAGISGVAASGTATLVGSPVTLPAGAATAVDTGVTTGNFTITLTGGTVKKLQIDERWAP